jgi:Ca2+-binding RTX toxin-like protein
MRLVALVLAGMALVLLLASGVALAITKVGTNGPDTIMGTKGPDKLVGRGSSDWIDGQGGKDVIRGGPGSDNVLSPAIGQLDGGGGADLISGGTGSDDLNDGPVSDASVDRLKGNEGNDFIITANRPVARDIVDCGAGRNDFAAADRKDTVRDNCERVKRFTPQPTPPGPVPID